MANGIGKQLAAQGSLQQQKKKNSSTYQSKYKSDINSTMKQIKNRSPFSYDLTGDQLYQQFRDQYTQQGQQAMMDTMGQAAALTGGYGSSYGQAVGQQTYQGYLQQMNDRIPELQQLAMQKYNMDTDALNTRLAMLQDADATAYARWSDRQAVKREAANQKQSLAQKQVDAMLAMGKTPSESLRKRAGYSGQYVKSAIEAWNAKNAPVQTGGGGGGGTGGGGGNDYSIAAAQAMEHGKSDDEIRRALIDAGASQSEADAAMTKGRSVLDQVSSIRRPR